MAPHKRILLIVTNSGEFERVGYRTGLWLAELTHFWDVAEEAGYHMDIASPAGGMAPIDPESLIVTELGAAVGLKGNLHERYEDRAFMDRLKDTLNVSEADPARYDAIYMAGGHGAMFDFPESEALARVTARFYESGKIVAAVCHGPCGLLGVKLSDGKYLVDGKNMTGFSWKEEVAAKRDDAVPFSLEDELRKRGAKYSTATLPFASHVVEDGLLISGQNPKSARAVGEAVLKASKRRSSGQASGSRRTIPVASSSASTTIPSRPFPRP
jgi:putative intracellular protease/amidase